MKICGLAHVGAFVRDVEVSEVFYSEILGFQRIWHTRNQTADGEERITFIQNGNAVIELVQLSNPGVRADGWFDHIAMNVEDIDGVVEKLKKKGVEFEEGSYTIAPHVFEYGSKWILFRGPDGEHLELNERLNKEKEKVL